MRKYILVKKIFNEYSFIKDNVLVVEDGIILGTQNGIDTGKDEIIDRRDFIYHLDLLTNTHMVLVELIFLR